MSRAILIFARTPEGEARAKRLRVSETAPLFDAVTAAWLDSAAALGAVPIVACNPADRRRLGRIRPQIARRWVDQRGAHFGERLAAAAGEAFAQGFDAVIVTGIDAPPPSREVLDHVFTQLESHAVDAVLGPARDGGINLFGLREPASDLLRSITPRQRGMVRVCREHFDSVLILDAWTDVDAPRHLGFTCRELAWREFAHLFSQALTTFDEVSLLPGGESMPSASLRAPPVH